MPGPLSKTVAGILKDALKQQGLTQKQLGAEIGRSPSQISKYLNAETTLDVEEFYAICRTLKLDPLTVLGAGVTTARRSTSP